LKRIPQNTKSFTTELATLVNKKNINYVQTMEELSHVSFCAIKRKTTEADNREMRWLARISIGRCIVHKT
jgi:hypothetical protein